MNYYFYYKGQTVSIYSDVNSNIKRIYDASIPKFKKHFAQELLLFGNQVRLRIKNNNKYLEWKEMANFVLKENDTIIIEPKDNLTTNSQNCHAPKRYDISKIENTYPGMPLTRPDVVYNQYNLPMNQKLNNRNQSESGATSKPNKYHLQKADQIQNQPQENHNPSNFERNGLRRSLGAAFAPQCELREYGNLGKSNQQQKDFHSSDSSISDMYTKAVINAKRKSINIHGTPNKLYNVEDRKLFSKSAPASPSKPIPPRRSPHTHLSVMNAFNVRTIGKKLNISVYKKPNTGLGFTIVTRDNQVLYGSDTNEIANSVVILVNKILKNGGAADDGRLQPGDRILEVNSVPVTSLRDATDKLRAIQENTSVDLLISRIEKDQPSIDLPSSDVLNSFPQLTFEISLNSKYKENHQLGLNIHYRNENDNPSLGPGIYIHSILSQSLAAQQGGLQVNDKLVGVNGQSLTDTNVESAISILKTAMQSHSVLSITVIRESSKKPINSTENFPQKVSHSNKDFNLKQDSNYYILPNKMTIDDKSRKLKHSQEISPSINKNMYSSSESCSQYDSDLHHSLASNAFEREGKGRRSMSEKGKIHEDATKYRLYKDTRDVTSKSAELPCPTDRGYSTLPTTSHKKKMHLDQSPPPLPNKTPTKPSQIKIKNAQESGPKSAHGITNRSASLRDSSHRNYLSHKTPSPRHTSETPTHEQPPIFNRAMNNSFKKAVQNSNEQKKTISANQSTMSPHSTKQYLMSPKDPSTQSEKQYQNYTEISKKSPNKVDSNIPRSHSVKNSTKKKSFNIKDFLAFTPNLNQSIKYNTSGKSDTFPLEKRADPQLPNYHQSPNIADVRNRPYSPIELPPEFQYCNDQTIIDSAKRVIEWQKKNADVISKENKIKDNSIYQPFNSHISSDSRVQKIKPNLNLRSTCNNTNQYHYETDPYDTIDHSLPYPVVHAQPKTNRSQPRSVNNTLYGISGLLNTTKNGAMVSSHSSNVVIPASPYQTNTNNSNNKKLSSNNSNIKDIYATVNKQQSTRKVSSSKQPSLNPSHNLHKNKYKF